MKISKFLLISIFIILIFKSSLGENYLLLRNRKESLILENEGINLKNNTHQTTIGNHLIQEWNKMWGGNRRESCSKIILDSSNNVYVLGSTDSFGAGYSDICLIKYDSSGLLVWNSTWGTYEYEYGSAIALDSSENIYVTGIKHGEDICFGHFRYENSDIFLVKFSSSGALLWNRTWGGEHLEHCSAMAIDSFDYLNLVGTIYNKATDSYDFFLLNYDSSGNQQWNRVWNGIEKISYPFISVNLDSLINIYFSGSIFFPGEIHTDILY